MHVCVCVCQRPSSSVVSQHQSVLVFGDRVSLPTDPEFDKQAGIQETAGIL